MEGFIKRVISLGDEFEVLRRDVGWLFDFDLRKGRIVSVRDERGKWFRARVLEASCVWARLVVFEEHRGEPESGLFLALIQAIPNKERMELIIEKAVELGVSEIQPVFTERSYRLEDLPQKKWMRWQERARRASEQCRRGVVPLVREPVELKRAIERYGDVELKIALWEGEKELGLKELAWSLLKGSGERERAEKAQSQDRATKEGLKTEGRAEDRESTGLVGGSGREIASEPGELKDAKAQSLSEASVSEAEEKEKISEGFLPEVGSEEDRKRLKLPQKSRISSVLLVNGPEGGLSKEEVSWLKGKGFKTVSLGVRILRTETSAIASLAILQFLFGDLGESLR